MEAPALPRKWRDRFGRAFRELPAVDASANRTGVAYVSVLFGTVVGTIALGSVEPVKALVDDRFMVDGSVFQEPGASALHHVLAFVLTVTSFVGYFASKNGPQLKVTFFNLPLVQIFLDSAMVVVYFFLAVYAESGKEPANARPEAVLVSFAFAIYAFWDFLGWRLRRDPLSQLALGAEPVSPRGYDDAPYGYRRTVTLVFFGLSLAVTAALLVFASDSMSTGRVFAVDLVLIVLLLLYRAVKAMGDDDIRFRSEGKRASDPAPAMKPVDYWDWVRIVPAAVKNDFELLERIAAAEGDHGLDLAANDGPAAERLRVAGAVELSSIGTGDAAKTTKAGRVYLALHDPDDDSPGGESSAP